MKNIRLGLNVDHVATLRQARGTSYPSVKSAAQVALESGADQITIHLREDRRHIQDADVPEVFEVTQALKRSLNFELGMNDEIISLALKIKPDWVCIVPEKREERTTEGGLNLLDSNQFEKLALVCQRFKKNAPLTKISLFVEAREEILRACIKLPINAVEIHTGEYAEDFLAHKDCTEHLNSFVKAEKIIKESGLSFHAGHGLTPESLKPLVELNIFEEYNIGHWAICDAIFNGLSHSVTQILKVIRGES